MLFRSEVGMLEKEKEKLMSIIFDVKGDGCRSFSTLRAMDVEVLQKIAFIFPCLSTEK